MTNKIWAALGAQGLTDLAFAISSDGELILPEDTNIPATKLERIRQVIADCNSPASLLADLKGMRSQEVNARRDEVIAGGYHHPFGGTVGTRILDQRDARDETAWLTVERKAGKLPADTPFPIRDARNDTFMTTAGAAVTAMDAMADWRMAVSQHSWNLKDAIEAAVDQAALDDIDITADWPV